MDTELCFAVLRKGQALSLEVIVGFSAAEIDTAVRSALPIGTAQMLTPLVIVMWPAFECLWVFELVAP